MISGKELGRPLPSSVTQTPTNIYFFQAQLEAEIENLSWKVERAETTDRGDLENQMDIAEKRRTTLLKDFLEFNTYSAPSSSKV